MKKRIFIIVFIGFVINGFSQKFVFEVNKIDVIGNVKHIKETSYKSDTSLHKLKYSGYPKEFFFDKNRNLKKTISYYFNGRVQSVDDFSYDGAKRLVLINQISNNDTATIAYKYFNDKRVERYKIVDQMEVKQFEYYFNNKNLIEKSIYFPSKPYMTTVIPVKTNYVYDNNDRLIEELVYNGNELIEKNTNDYDDNGFKWSSKNLETNRDIFYYNELDSLGNKISLIKLDNADKELSRQTWTLEYDEFGNWYKKVWIMTDMSIILIVREIEYY